MSNIKVRSQLLSSSKDGSFEEEEIYTRLYSAIFEQQLAPGTKLGEDSLAEIFKVSRTRIRRVLLRLSHDYLVRLEPNRGAFIASPSPDEAKQIFAARRVVESAIVRDIVTIITPDQLAILSDLTRAEQLACDQGDRRNVIKLSGQFHLQLGEIAGNEFLLKFLKDLISQTSLIIALYEVPGLPLCVKSEHADLLQSIASRDADIAVATMLNHLRALEATLNLEQHLSRPAKLEDILGTQTGRLS